MTIIVIIIAATRLLPEPCGLLLPIGYLVALLMLRVSDFKYGSFEDGANIVVVN